MRSLLLAVSLLSARAAVAEIPLLWVPPESFSDWAGLDAGLRKSGEKFTVALTAEMLTPEAEKILDPWIAKGRLEVALRLAGDPLLPLIAENAKASRPQDVVNRIAAAREQYRLLFGSAPEGFLPGAGAASPSLFPDFKAMGLAWAAVGDYADGSGEWAQAAGVVLVPLRADTGGSARVIDEADGLAPTGAFLSSLLSGSGSSWTTVGQAVKDRKKSLADAGAVARWPPFGGNLDPWTAGPARALAWQRYGDAALALEQYQNSGGADLKSLEKAADELYGAQSSRYYRLAGSPDPAVATDADRDLRARLIAVYRRIKATPPESLFAATGPTDAREETPSDVHVARGDSWLEFSDPPGSAGQLLSLKVEWSDSEVSLVFRLKELGSLRVDVYIDLNHVAGAGSSALLSGVDGFVQSKDAWEYAATATSQGTSLYRSRPGSPPVLIGPLKASVDPAAREIRLAIPRSMVRGSPQRWGYVALALDPALGPGLAGLLAPLEQQKAPSGGQRRLIAVRLPETQRP